MVAVRVAVPEDAGAIAAIHVRAWQAAYRGLLPDDVIDRLSIPLREERWRQMLGGSSPPLVYLGVTAESPVGFCAVLAPSLDDDAEGDVAELSALYVEPDAWRTGVGRALMDAALEGLRTGGWRWLTLWVLATNRPARDFYAHFRLLPDGAEKLHAGSGAIEVRLRRAIGV